MSSSRILRSAFTALLLTSIALPALAQSFRVQCPDSTTLHPAPAQGGGVAAGIKCQQISGGDGYATMGDVTESYMFSFGPLSGLADIL